MKFGWLSNETVQLCPSTYSPPSLNSWNIIKDWSIFKALKMFLSKKLLIFVIRNWRNIQDLVRKFQSGFFAFQTKHFLPRSSLGKYLLFLLLEGMIWSQPLNEEVKQSCMLLFCCGFSYPADVEVLIMYGYWIRMPRKQSSTWYSCTLTLFFCLNIFFIVITQFSLKKTSTVIGWFLVTCPWSYSRAVFPIWLFKGKFK